MSARSASAAPAVRRGPPVPETGAYLGAILLEDQLSPVEFNRVTGIRHAMFMTFVDFPEVLDAKHPHSGKAARFFGACREAGAVPVLTIECFGGLNSYTAADIVRFADLLHAAGVPMILRWNHEMNGSWYPWGQQPGLYVRKFREFASVIRDRAPGVAMAWTPNQGWGYPWPGCEHFNPHLPPSDPYTPYYPGDEFVDWVGLSFYHWGETRGANQPAPAGKWAQANGVGNGVPNLHDLVAVARGKPMLIAETSALFDVGDSKGGGATELAVKTSWISQVYNVSNRLYPSLPQAFPMVKALFWFNVVKHEAEVNGRVDWSVSNNPSVARFYADIVSNPYFIQG